MAVYKANDCIVISDEIWSDIILEGYKHIPIQSINEDAKNRTIAFYAPSKTFNLSGLIGSYHIIYNQDLRNRVVEKSENTYYNNTNLLSMYALIGAYKNAGMEWVDELRSVITKNVNYVCDYFDEKVKGIEISRPQGTYMLFLECDVWCKENQKTVDELLKSGWNVGVAWQDGRQFHGKYAIRMNLALPFSRVKEVIERLDTYVFNTR